MTVSESRMLLKLQLSVCIHPEGVNKKNVFYLINVHLTFLKEEITPVSWVGWICFWCFVFGVSSSLILRLRSPLLQQKCINLVLRWSVCNQALGLWSNIKRLFRLSPCSQHPQLWLVIFSYALCHIPGYPNNEKKKLVYLGGTIPVVYEGTANIVNSYFTHSLHVCCHLICQCPLLCAILLCISFYLFRQCVQHPDPYMDPRDASQESSQVLCVSLCLHGDQRQKQFRWRKRPRASSLSEQLENRTF